MSQDLAVRLGPLTLRHPLLNASGTLDLLELAETMGDEILEDPPVAAYVPKTVTLAARDGNPPPRLVETPAGMLNSVGLPNDGVEAFCASSLPRLLALRCPIIVSIGGFSVQEYGAAAEVLMASLLEAVGSKEEAIASRVGLELNVSCPNVHSGCMLIGSDPAETAAVVSCVRAVWPPPFLLAVKLTPNVTDIASIARAAEEAGASAVSLTNTFKGLVLDRVTLRPRLGGGAGGLSGPAIRPLALRCVYEVASTVQVPIVGMGGAATVEDVVEFLACGATAVAVGSSGLTDPLLCARMAEELGSELARRSLSLRELTGRALAG